MPTTKIAVLGLGAMGSRIATNLIKAEYPLVVWNRSVEPTKALAALGATVASTPKQAAEQATVVISMVTDNEASKAVWTTPETGALLGLAPSKVAVECSTLTTRWTQTLADKVAQAGSPFVAAPVVGSRPQAEAQKLISLVGGDTNTVGRVQPILKASSGAIHHVGTAAQAMAMKLAVNALFGIQVAALAELLGLLKQQGISPTEAMDCLGQIPVTSLAAKGAGASIVAQNYAAMFPIHLVEKDFRYACESGENAPATVAIQQMYKEAIAKGHGEENITAIARLFLS